MHMHIIGYKVNSMTTKKIMFFTVFVLLGFLALQVKISHLAGSKATFTLFDSFAPIAGAFIGNTLGAVGVVAMQGLNFLWHGSNEVDLGFLIRLITPIFAVLYFGRKSNVNIIVPLLAIIAFNLHPIGRSVWFYSIFWLIPIICYFYQEKSLVAKSIGSTFIAHAVGGALWIWAFNLPAQVWIGLIPVVIIERILFAFGIAISYLLMKKLLDATHFNTVVYYSENNQ